MTERGAAAVPAGSWLEAVRAAGGTAPPAAVEAAGTELLGRWAEPHRRYHDLEHLAEVLAAVDLLAAEAADVAVVRLAAWFHDAVYVGHPGQDEEDSAVLAEQVLAGLGVPAERVARVAGLVRMTAAHDPADGDPDAAVLNDADLAVLAAPAERYERYRTAVREEYRHVPDELFRAGRAAVLSTLAGRDPLFRTGTGRDRWQAAARANLAAELAALTSAGGPTPPSP
jgi:predicted metal-dependent HD superfamily phosphohydrolase